MADTEQFGLKPNPFHHLVRDEDVHVWAGMPDTKNRIQDVVQSVLPDDIGSSEFAILVGELGSGKTHALRYFVHQIRSREGGYPFYVSRAVHSEKNIFGEMFQSLVEECGDTFFSQLSQKVNDAAKAAAHNQSLPGAEVAIVDSAFAPVEQPLAHAVMRGNAMGFLKQKAADDVSAATQLAVLIKIMTTSIKGQPAPYPAVYLFLDEVEEMLTLKPAISSSFWRSCRELVNRIDGQFGMIFSFSEETAVLDAAIPPAMLERRTRPYIEVKDLDLVGAKQFVKDFLEKSRAPDFKPPHPFYPFTEEAVDAMLGREQQALLPRRIILTLRRVFRRGIAKLGDEKEFSKEIAEEVLDEMGV